MAYTDDDELTLHLDDMDVGSPPVQSPQARTTNRTITVPTAGKRPAEETIKPSTRSQKNTCPEKKPTKGPRGKSKLVPIRDSADCDSDSEDEYERYRPGSSNPARDTTQVSYYEGVYRRLDDLAAKVDTLINVMAESTRQVKLLVGLQASSHRVYTDLCNKEHDAIPSSLCQLEHLCTCVPRACGPCEQRGSSLAAGHLRPSS